MFAWGTIVSALSEPIAKPQLNTRWIDTGELASCADALRQIYHRELDVLVVRGAFEREALAEVVRKIEGAEPARLDWTPQQNPDPSVVQMKLLGESLTPYVHHPDGPELDHYFAVADRLRGTLRDLFGHTHDFETRIEQLLGALSGGRPVSIPQHSDGRAYTPATVRRLPPGTDIPLHVGNFFLESGGYRYLKTQIALQDQLSYFVTLKTPDGGGSLLVYPLEWGDPETPRLPSGLWDQQAVIARYEPAAIRPEAGDLLVFDGGRYYHRVDTIEGENTRWTIGGFVGFSPDMSRVFYWN